MVGENLRPCTTEIKGVKIQFSNFVDGRRVFLIDTPGFSEDENVCTTLDVTQMIKKWLTHRSVPITTTNF